jgi:hypothetical protein
MAKEPGALKSRKHDDDPDQAGMAPPKLPDSTQDSPDHPLNLSGIAVLDVSGLGLHEFVFEECIIGRDTLIKIFQL